MNNSQMQQRQMQQRQMQQRQRQMMGGYWTQQQELKAQQKLKSQQQKFKSQKRGPKCSMGHPPVVMVPEMNMGILYYKCPKCGRRVRSTDLILKNPKSGRYQGYKWLQFSKK